MTAGNMVRWANFAAAEPSMAGVGERMLSGGNVGILATVTADGAPRVAPVAPIFFAEGIYLSVSSTTPKLQDLQARETYAMHALLDASDEEFQISGAARAVTGDQERAGVVAAIPFPSFEANDPIFELMIGQALWVRWSGPGKDSQKRVWRR